MSLALIRISLADYSPFDIKQLSIRLRKKSRDIRFSTELHFYCSIGYIFTFVISWAPSRKALHDISWEACSFNDSHMDSADAFNEKEEEVRARHPGWFDDEDDEIGESDLPATKGDVEDASQTTLRHSGYIQDQLAHATQSLQKISGRVSMVLGISIGAILATIWQRW